MIKRILAITLTVMLMCTALAGNVSAFDTEIVTGCTTVAGDMYDSVSYTDVIDFNVAPEGYNGTPYDVDNEAETMTLNINTTNAASSTVNNNTDATNAIDLSGIDWINSGTVTITFDVTLLSKAEGMTVYAGLIGKVHDSTGANKWPFGGTGVGQQALIEAATFSSTTEAGGTVSAKVVYEFSSDGLVINAYAKDENSDDYSLIIGSPVIKDNGTFSKEQYYIYKLVPYVQTRNVKGVATVKYSNICITESYRESVLEDISNNYLQTESKDVNYYIPDGYSTATLTLDGETIASFSAADADAAGSYKTTIDFSNFDIGNDIPLTLTVNFPEDDPEVKTVNVNINAPITEPAVEDISGGRYSDVGILSFDYEVPHEFGIATLKFNDSVVKTLASEDGDKGGIFTESINIADYVELGEDEAERDVSVVLTVDGFPPVVREITVYKYYAEAELEDISGEYITTDSITFEYTLPTDYISASLELDGNVISEFSSETTDGGKYSKTVDLSDYDLSAGDTVELTLSVELDNASPQTKTVNITLVETIVEPAMTGITEGTRYDHNGTLTFGYQIPHSYETAVLKIGDSTIREFNYDSGDKGGTFSAEVSLADYVQLGENELERTFTVSLVVDDFEPVECDIVLYKYYETAELENISGYYTKADKVPYSYTLPTEYTAASLKLGDRVIGEFTPDNKIGGVYTDTLDLSMLNMGDETVENVNLVLTVDGEPITRALTVYNVSGFDVISVNSKELKDGFDSSSTVFNTMNNGGIDTDTFKDTEYGNVYKFVFNVDKDTQSRGSFRSPDLSLSKDYFVDISCDFYLTSPKMQLGLHLTDLTGGTVLNWWMSNGVFMGNSSNTYEAGRWYHLTQRIIPAHYTEDGKPLICWYVDGKIIGSTELAYNNSGLKMIAVDVRNGSSMEANGPVYIDNISYSQGAPRYTAELMPVDDEGNELDDVDYADPRIAIVFNQKMNAKNISTDTVKLTSFNGTELEAAITYDEATSRVYIEPVEALVPGSEYTVTLSKNIKSMVSNGYDDDTEFTFVTASQPVFMQSATSSASLAEIPVNTPFTVEVSLKNNSGASTTGYIYAAYYCGNQLQSISSTPVSGPTANQTYNMPLTTRDAVPGERKVVIYYTNGRNDFSAIDTFEIR